MFNELRNNSHPSYKPSPSSYFQQYPLTQTIVQQQQHQQSLQYRFDRLSQLIQSSYLDLEKGKQYFNNDNVKRNSYFGYGQLNTRKNQDGNGRKGQFDSFMNRLQGQNNINSVILVNQSTNCNKDQYNFIQNNNQHTQPLSYFTKKTNTQQQLTDNNQRQKYYESYYESYSKKQYQQEDKVNQSPTQYNQYYQFVPKQSIPMYADKLWYDNNQNINRQVFKEQLDYDDSERQNKLVRQIKNNVYIQTSLNKDSQQSNINNNNSIRQQLKQSSPVTNQRPGFIKQQRKLNISKQSINSSVNKNNNKSLNKNRQKFYQSSQSQRINMQQQQLKSYKDQNNKYKNLFVINNGNKVRQDQPQKIKQKKYYKQWQHCGQKVNNRDCDQMMVRRNGQYHVNQQEKKNNNYMDIKDYDQESKYSLLKHTIDTSTTNNTTSYPTTQTTHLPTSNHTHNNNNKHHPILTTTNQDSSLKQDSFSQQSFYRYKQQIRRQYQCDLFEFIKQELIRVTVENKELLQCQDNDFVEQEFLQQRNKNKQLYQLYKQSKQRFTTFKQSQQLQLQSLQKQITILNQQLLYYQQQQSKVTTSISTKMYKQQQLYFKNKLNLQNVILKNNQILTSLGLQVEKKKGYLQNKGFVQCDSGSNRQDQVYNDNNNKCLSQLLAQNQQLKRQLAAQQQLCNLTFKKVINTNSAINQLQLKKQQQLNKLFQQLQYAKYLVNYRSKKN